MRLIAFASTTLLAGGVIACGLPSEPRISGACIGVTNVGGVHFVAYSGALVPPEGVAQGAVVATVTSNRGCDDTPEPDPADSYYPIPELADGESNHLDAGTRLCAIVGRKPEEYLMVCDRPADLRLIITSLHDEPTR